MKIRATALLATLAILLTACGSPPYRPPAVTDSDLNGTWLIRKAELGGKSLPMPGFALIINGTEYRAGAVANGGAPNDRGTLVLFGDEVAGEARRIDVIGLEGPNKGKRYPAIYRFSGRELEICYDLAEKDRPTDFVSREGTRVLRVTYSKK